MLHRLKKIALIGLLAISSTLFAITPISGTITEDTVWTAANGPYTVVGNIKVAPGVTLTIEGGAEVNPVEVKFLSNLLKSHATHFDNTGKGPGINDCNVCHNAKFKDDRPLETTTVCNACHSPDGAFPGELGLMDPVIGAKANFASGGIYEVDGLTIKPGKEKWCSSCHDAQQSISNPVDGATATYAPNVVGDNDTYGYWKTGHGKSISNCLECHDANKKHFDHEHRTYEIDETNNSVVNPWGDSYRLRTKSAKSDENFCLTCHNQDQLRNVNEQSNFKTTNSGHSVHVWGMMNSLLADTDYDGVNDARPVCTVCHNTHGSKSNKMTRTGELASTPGTDDRTPGLNQTYAKPAQGPFSTATWTPDLPSSGTFEVFAWWKKNGSLEPKAKYTINHDGGTSSVILQQASEGNEWTSLGTYSFSAGTSNSVVLSADYAIGKLLVADQIGWDTNGDGTPDIVVDDTDSGFSSINLFSGEEWPVVGWLNARVLNNQERYTLDVPLGDSTAGWVRFNPQSGINRTVTATNVCQNCHGAIIYERTPFMGPKLINRYETKRWVLNDGTGVAEAVVSVIDPDYDMVGGSVTIDASMLGGVSAGAMTDNGDRTYSYLIPIAAGTADKSYELPITAVDSAGNIGTAVSHVYVKSSEDAIYKDNEDAVHTHPENWERNTLDASAYSGSYVSTRNFKEDPENELIATWEPTIKKTGSYKVYVWLNGNTLTNQNATYTVKDNNGTISIPVNQESGVAGGGWKLLGTFDYLADSKALISVNATGIGVLEQLYVDAVKLELVP